MAKKQYIPQFFKRDRDGMTALSRTGIARIETLKEKCNLADSRIRNWIKDGYAEKIYYKVGKQEKEVKEAIILTKKGKELVEQKWNVRDHYHAQTQSPYHDLALSDKYFSLPENIRETWKTETQVRNQFMEKLQQLREQGHQEQAQRYEDMLNKGLISMPDGMYTNEQGIEVAHEIITDSYGRAEMLAKETTCEILGLNYETTRI